MEPTPPGFRSPPMYRRDPDLDSYSVRSMEFSDDHYDPREAGDAPRFQEHQQHSFHNGAQNFAQNQAPPPVPNGLQPPPQFGNFLRPPPPRPYASLSIQYGL